METDWAGNVLWAAYTRVGLLHRESGSSTSQAGKQVKVLLSVSTVLAVSGLDEVWRSSGVDFTRARRPSRNLR